MLQTVLCTDAVGIDVPVVQAGMSVYTSPRLASAVSNAGGLGSTRRVATPGGHPSA